MALARGRRRLLIFLALLAWMGVILFLSTRSSLPTDTVVAGWLGQYQDEVGHLGEYTVLGILTYMAFRSRSSRRRTFVFSLAFCVAFSLGDETIQGLVPNRSTEFKDVVLDTVAAVGALTATMLLEPRLRKVFPSRDTTGDGQEFPNVPTLGNH